MTKGQAWERYKPLLGGVCSAALGCFVLNGHLPTASSVTQAFASTVDVGAIGVGFLATAKTVLLSLQGTRAGEHMRKSGLQSQLLKYLMVAIKWSFAAAVLSLICIFVDGQIPEAYPRVRLAEFGLWIFVLTVTAMSSYRVISVFFLVLSPSDPSTLEDKGEKP